MYQRFLRKDKESSTSFLKLCHDRDPKNAQTLEGDDSRTLNWNFADFTHTFRVKCKVYLTKSLGKNSVTVTV